MPQTPANKEYNTFVKGIITEASPLTFPPNASIDEQNFVLNRNGSRQRRLGMEYENDYALNNTGILQAGFEAIGVSAHRWESVNEDATISFDIVQVGDKLWFYDSLAPAPSAAPKNQGIALTLSGDNTVKWQSSALGGRLVFVTGAPNVFTLEYDSGTDVVSVQTHGLLSRDIWGIDDGLDTDERSTTLSSSHEYNLLNQGWGQDNPDSGAAYYDSFKASPLGTYPSNADLVHLGKDPSDADTWKPGLVARSFVGTTPAPKGHFIVDVFDRSTTRSLSATNPGLLNNIGFGDGRWGGGIFGSIAELLLQGGFSPAPGLPSLPVDKTESGVLVTTTYAERFFYAGMESAVTGGDSKSPLLGHMVFFSQLVDSADKVGKCYQEGDPSSEDQPDVLATDGGFIKIPQMSRCIRLVPFANSLIVFAENGIWEITGSDSGFKATDFQVIKVTDTGAISASSIIEVEDRIYFWSKGGIYNLFRDQVSLGVQIGSISETTVQSLFEGYTISATSNVTGAYDAVTKQVRWLVNTEDTYNGFTERGRYDTEVIYDVILSAFYIAKLPTPDGDMPYVAEAITTPGFLSSDEVINVVVSADNVVSAGNNVALLSTVREGGFSRTKYLTIVPSTLGETYKFTYSYYRDNAFEDWATAQGGTGTDAHAFLLTGYETLGDTQRQKQVPYITTHFERTEQGFLDTGGGNLEAINPSSCFIQSQWDFANSATSNKFGQKFQAYRLKRNYMPTDVLDTFDYGYEVITTKSKLRGRGRALSILFETEPAKDLVMLGWGTIYGANTNV